MVIRPRGGAWFRDARVHAGATRSRQPYDRRAVWNTDRPRIVEVLSDLAPGRPVSAAWVFDGHSHGGSVMRQVISALILGLTLATPAFAQSGSAGGSSAGGAGTTSSTGTTTGAPSVGTTGVGPSGTTAGSQPNPLTPNDQMRANSGQNLRAPATTVAPGTVTTGQSGGVRGARAQCSPPDCSSPLSGRYMAIVDSMARIAGVPVERRARR
jgi:hypothetical protein